MMDLHILAAALEGLIWLGVLGIIVYGPWQKVCVDFARDVIFEQRDIIFDLAADGHLQFGSNPYESIRAAMNSMIRLAHCLTGPRVLLAAWHFRARGVLPTRRSSVRAIIESIEDQNVRSAVRNAFATAEMAALAALVFRSPLIFLLFASAKIGGHVGRVKRRAEDWLIDILERAVTHELRSF